MNGFVIPEEQLVTEIVARDIRRSTAFYVSLGFQLWRDGGDFVELTWEGHRLFLAEGTAFPEGVAAEPGPLLAFAAANVRIMVPDVDACWQRARELGSRVITPIDDRGYGLRDFIIADPDGFGVRFASPCQAGEAASR